MNEKSPQLHVYTSVKTGISGTRGRHMQSLSNFLLSAFLLISTCFTDSISAQSAPQPVAADKVQQSAAPRSQEPAAAPQPNPSAAGQPKPAPAFGFGLEDGTPVPLKLARELASAKEAVGNRVDFEVADVVIAKGAPVTAYVDQNTALDRSKFATPPASTPPVAPALQPPTPPSAAWAGGRPLTR